MIANTDIVLATAVCRPVAWKSLIASGVTSEFFPDACHRDLFEALVMQSAERRRHSAAAIISKTKLAGTKILVEKYIQSSQEFVTDDLATALRGVILDKRRCELVGLATSIAGVSGRDGWGSESDIESMRLACKKMASIGGSLTEVRKIETVDDNTVQREFVEHLKENQKRYQQGGKVGLTSGLREVDECLGGGFRSGRMYLVGGRTGGGKSQFATNLALASMENNNKVLFFSAEMTRNDILKRIFANFTDTRFDILDKGNFGDEVIENAKEFATTAICSDLIKVYHAFDGSLAAIESIIDVEMRSEIKPKIAVVDYAQMLKSHTERKDRLRELQEISSSLKRITMRHEIALIVLVQLNRGAESDGPELGHVMGNDSFSHDCDGAIILHVTKESQAEGCAGIKMRKMRHGEARDLLVGIDFSRSKFFDLTKEEAEIKIALLNKKPGEEKKTVNFGDIKKKRKF